MTLHALTRRPGTKMGICLLFAAGVAIATVSFSFFHGLFVQALPFPDPQRLIHISLMARGEARMVAWKHIDAWREANGAFETLAAFQESGFYMTGDGAEPVHVVGASVSHDMAKVLGIRPVLGRYFLPDEDVKGGKPVMMLTHHLWQSHFQGAREVLGKTVYLDHQPFEIVGVLPPNAVFPGSADFWRTLARNREDGLEGVGRLKEGVTLDQAAADLKRIVELRRDKFNPDAKIQPVLEPLREHDVKAFALMVAVVNSAVAGLFLIVCVNASGLIFSLGMARRREFSIRLALGAGRWRVVRLLLGESLALGVAGGLLGVLFSYALLRALLALMPDVLPSWIEISINGWTLGFAVATTLAASLAAGLLPALQFSRSHEIAPRGVTTSSHRTMNGLVIAEVGLAVMVLTAGALVMKAYQKVNSTELGFDAGDTTESFALDPWGQSDEKTLRFYGEYLIRLRTVPGVRAAAAAFEPPFGVGRGVETTNVTGRFPGLPETPIHIVTPGYFDAVGIRLLAGRDFAPGDAKEAVIVSEALARRVWPGQISVVGNVLEAEGVPNELVRRPVIGVVADSRLRGPETNIAPEVYAPHAFVPFSQMYVIIRGGLEPREMVKEADRIARQLDPGVTPFDIRTLRERIDRVTWLRRTYSWVLFVFSGLALVLIAFGLYAVLAFLVSERRRELGIRSAVGATRVDIAGIVLRRGFALTAIGATIGLASAGFLNHRLQPMLAGGSDRDPAPYALALSAVVVSWVLAALIPAYRAASLDPMEVLRTE